MSWALRHEEIDTFIEPTGVSGVIKALLTQLLVWAMAQGMTSHVLACERTCRLRLSTE